MLLDVPHVVQCAIAITRLSPQSHATLSSNRGPDTIHTICSCRCNRGCVRLDTHLTHDSDSSHCWCYRARCRNHPSLQRLRIQTSQAESYAITCPVAKMHGARLFKVHMTCDRTLGLDSFQDISLLERVPTEVRALQKVSLRSEGTLLWECKAETRGGSAS